MKVYKDIKVKGNVSYEIIKLYNHLYNWKLSDTELKMIVIILTLKETKNFVEIKDVLKKSLNITDNSINTVLSKLYKGKFFIRENNNLKLLNKELENISNDKIEITLKYNKV